MCFILRFCNTFVSKTAAMLKIVYSRYIYRECNVLVLPNRSHISIFLTKLFNWSFLVFYFKVTDKKTFDMKSKTKRYHTHFSNLILYHLFAYVQVMFLMPVQSFCFVKPA